MQHEHYGFKCADIGIQCGFSARAHTEGELMEEISKHASEVHGMKSVDDATLKAIKGAIKVDHGC